MKNIKSLTSCLFILVITMGFGSSARLLDGESETTPVIVNAATPPIAVVPPPASLDESPIVVAPANSQPGVASTTALKGGDHPASIDESPIVVVPANSQPGVASTTALKGGDHHLSFFMHDILGGSNPSALPVTGIVSNAAVNGQLPFAKPNGGVFPPNNGVSFPNGNNPNSGNNVNNAALLPFLTGLGGGNLVQNNIGVNGGNGMPFVNNGNGLPFVNGGQLPTGTNIQKLEFGTLTVIDDELTEGHELGSAVLGKAQGFYVASSEDGNSQTMAFTAMFESGDFKDSVSFFGVHRTAVSESQIAVMGGTGKYQNAKGYATIQTLPSLNQHTTDGVETILQFTVYLSY